MPARPLLAIIGAGMLTLFGMLGVIVVSIALLP